MTQPWQWMSSVMPTMGDRTRERWRSPGKTGMFEETPQGEFRPSSAGSFFAVCLLASRRRAVVKLSASTSRLRR